MNNKYSIVLLTTSVLSYSVSPAWGQDKTSSEITFACEESNGVPITVAKNKEGQTKTIFYWKEKVLAYKTPSTSQELCNDVSLKLNRLSINDYDFSTFILLGLEQLGIPVICAGFSDEQSCTQVLLFLRATENPVIEADSVLKEILNMDIAVNGYDRYRCDISHRYCNPSTYKINLF